MTVCKWSAGASGPPVIGERFARVDRRSNEVRAPVSDMAVPELTTTTRRPALDDRRE
jgi:hypothetical protein